MEKESDATIAGKMDTLRHIQLVRSLLADMIMELDKRAQLHDQSKLESPEKEILGEHTPKLGKVQYGSPEYNELLTLVKPALDNHYAKNRHHPQHWPNGVDDMTLIDLVEMLCDWKASTMRMKDGNIRRSIAINADRFKISPQLTKIFENTVREHFKE